jgi:hypothetical protein
MPVKLFDGPHYVEYVFHSLPLDLLNDIADPWDRNIHMECLEYFFDFFIDIFTLQPQIAECVYMFGPIGLPTDYVRPMLELLGFYLMAAYLPQFFHRTDLASERENMCTFFFSKFVFVTMMP